MPNPWRGHRLRWGYSELIEWTHLRWLCVPKPWRRHRLRWVKGITAWSRVGELQTKLKPNAFRCAPSIGLFYAIAYKSFAELRFWRACVKKPSPDKSGPDFYLSWRRGGDSNPRYLAVHKLSKLARSATLTPLQDCKDALSRDFYFKLHNKTF